MKEAAHHTLLLFSSASTLFCCALPALFVALGAGATLAGIVSSAPQLVALSAHKQWLFLFSGLLLGVSGWWRYRTRNAPCPTDPKLARACTRLRRTGGWIYGLSLALFAVGFFFAYIAPHLIIVQ